MLVKNVERLHGSRSLDGYPDLQRDTEELIRYVTEAVQNNPLPMSHIASQCDTSLKIPMGNTLALINHLIATRSWNIDMNLEFIATQPLKLLDTNTGNH